MQFQSIKNNYFTKYDDYFKIEKETLVINDKKYILSDVIYDNVENKEIIEKGFEYKNIIVDSLYKNILTFWLIKKEKNKDYFKKYNFLINESEGQQNLFIYDKTTKKNIIIKGKIINDYISTQEIDKIKYHIITLEMFSKK